MLAELLVLVCLTSWQESDSLARTALQQGRLDEAETYFREALKGAEAAGAIEPGVVSCLTGLALVYDGKGEAAESERLYELAMRNMEGLVGGNSPRYADFLPQLASIYLRHGKAEHAEILFKRAITIREKSFGPDDIKVAQMLDLYADFLRKLNRTTEAEATESRSREIRAKLNTQTD